MHHSIMIMAHKNMEHLGGNVACQKTEGIDVHLYGQHVFLWTKG